MKSPSGQSSSDGGIVNPYKAIGDAVRFSERTVRYAFSGHAVPISTARRIAEQCQIPILCFRIKEDRRGSKKK